MHLDELVAAGWAILEEQPRTNTEPQVAGREVARSRRRLSRVRYSQASLAGSGPWRERPWRQKLTTLDMFVRMKMDSAS